MPPPTHPHHFTPAAPTGESIVHGSERPGYGLAFPDGKIPASEIARWVGFMQSQGIRRVCCLLGPAHFRYYQTDLLSAYRAAFGPANVLSTPIEDFHLATQEQLTKEILPFFSQASRTGQPVVAHCSAGLGRTGHVLAAWLVHGRGYPVGDALDAVVATGRNPYEAVQTGRATPDQLFDLLAACVPPKTP